MTPRAAALAELLAQWPRKRVQLKELWDLLDRADPASRGSAQRRRLLSEAVTELLDAGFVTASRPVNDGIHPPLPSCVQRIERTAARAPRARVIWHYEIHWADQIRLSDSQTKLLRAVSDWLFAGGTASSPAPLRERAYEITGNEKAFDGGRLFGGKLTHDVLRAYRVILPLHVARLGEGPELLVVENSDTFDSLRRTLAAHTGPIGRIAWGAGAAFESSVLSLTEPDGGAPTKIHYFGDIDAAGLRIPASASALATDAGLAPVRPATALYTALLALGRPQPDATRVTAERAHELAAWLDPQHRTSAAELLECGHRLAQEAVGIAALASLEDWPPG